MKAKIIRKIIVDLTLDSSEAIMFNKGGKHKVSLLPLNFFNFSDSQYADAEIEISIQIERGQQSRYDFITGESEKHKYDAKFDNVSKL